VPNGHSIDNYYVSSVDFGAVVENYAGFTPTASKGAPCYLTDAANIVCDNRIMGVQNGGPSNLNGILFATQTGLQEFRLSTMYNCAFDASQVLSCGSQGGDTPTDGAVDFYSLSVQGGAPELIYTGPGHPDNSTQFYISLFREFF
jgi:hypothetical protein